MMASKERPPPDIPGFHYDPVTKRYYSLANPPPEFREKVQNQKLTEENRKTKKRITVQVNNRNAKTQNISKRKNKKNKKKEEDDNNKNLKPVDLVCFGPQNLLHILARRQFDGAQRSYGGPSVPNTLTSMFPKRFQTARNKQSPIVTPIRNDTHSGSYMFQCSRLMPNALIHLKPYSNDKNMKVVKVQVDVMNNQNGQTWRRYRRIQASDILSEDDLNVSGESCSSHKTFVHDTSNLPSDASDEFLFATHSSSILLNDEATLYFCTSYYLRVPNHYYGDAIECMSSAYGEASLFNSTVRRPFEDYYSLNGGSGGVSTPATPSTVWGQYTELHHDLIKPLYCVVQRKGRTSRPRSPQSQPLTQKRFETMDIRYRESGYHRYPIPWKSLSGYSNGSIRLVTYDSNCPELLVQETKLPQAGTIREVRFHPTNVNQFLVSGDENFLRLYDDRMFAPDGSTSGGNGKVRGSYPVLVYNEHRSTHHYHQIIYDTTTNLLVCSGSDNLVRFWNGATGQLERCFDPAEHAHHPINSKSYPVQVFYSGDFRFTCTERSDAFFTVYEKLCRMYGSRLENTTDLSDVDPIRL